MSDTVNVINSSKTSIGIEFGSTRIKAVLIDDKANPLASGSFDWENSYKNGIWTYSLDEVRNGLQTAFAKLKADVEKKYSVKLTTAGALGISGMMHGYLAFDKAGNQLAEFRTWRNTITAQAAENKYVGVSCGKLDQSCEVLCKKDHLLYLDTKDDSYELIPRSPKMKDYKIAILFSGLERSLANSKYNLRQDECKSAAYALLAHAGMEYSSFAETRLRDVPQDIYLKYRDLLPENWKRRADHYFAEFKRA
ncbi:MAG: hypothetical protein IKN56_00140, partial [Clostridia bacterium]|nr:hypothetical protein [Clostridia bacterium]